MAKLPLGKDNYSVEYFLAFEQILTLPNFQFLCVDFPISEGTDPIPKILKSTAFSNSQNKGMNMKTYVEVKIGKRRPKSPVAVCAMWCQSPIVSRATAYI